MSNSDNKKLSVGVIGAGEVVYKSHLPVLLAMEGVSLAWITDIDYSRAKQVAYSYRIKPLFLPENLKSLPCTDIVLLAAPYGVRKPYYDILWNRQTALYVEKPISRSAREHRELCLLFPPWRLAVGLQRRSWAPVILLKKVVQESVFGVIKRVEFKCGGGSIVTWGKSFVSDAKVSGGGILFEHAVHGLDIVLYVTSSKFVRFNRVKTIVDKGFDVHAEGEAVLLGASGDFTLDFKASWLSGVAEGLTFIFEHAVITMSFSQPQIIIKSFGGERIVTLTDQDLVYPVTAFQTLYEHWRSFLLGISGKEGNYVSAAESFSATELIEKIYDQGIRK